MTTLALSLVGLLIAVAVGLAANAIASRSFTPGVDALPSAGSLAPPASPPAKPATTPKPTTTAKPATTPKPKPNPKPATTTPKPVTNPKPATTSDTHAGDDGSRSGGDTSGKGSGGSDSSGHGSGHGDDD